MKNIYEVLQLKEKELAKARNEVNALRLAIHLVEEPSDYVAPQNSNPPAPLVPDMKSFP